MAIWSNGKRDMDFKLGSLDDCEKSRPTCDKLEHHAVNQFCNIFIVQNIKT